MNVLVTGANGFIGTHLCGYLAGKSISCRQAVRRKSNSGGNTVAVGEIDASTDWSPALVDIDVVVHLAARVHVLREGAQDPLAEFRRINVDGTARLARQAAAAGARRFIYMSTIKVNGEETRARPFCPEDRPAPLEPYSVSKLEAESVLQQIGRETAMEVVILRPPLVYGKGVGGNFTRLLRLVQQGWYLPLGSVRNKRSLVGVENLCSLITVCLAHPAAANRVLLVSDGRDVSTPDLIRMIAQACGVAPRLLPCPLLLLGLVARLCGKGKEMQRLAGSLQIDSSRTRSLVHWHPPLSMEEGLRHSVC